jgi:alkaline phosphatase
MSFRTTVLGYLTAGLGVLLLPGFATSANPKVILIIGDGMDDQSISIARNYLAGADGNLAMDAMQYRGAIKPQTVLEENPAAHVHVTGSAPAATAMASGIVSSGKRISTFAQTGVAAVTIMELANEAGIATGVVTTARVTDATPAAFMTHTVHRDCQGPDNMVQTDICGGEHKLRGGRGSIAEQIADGEMDVVLGGGRQYFDQVIDSDTNATVADLVRANGFTLITNLAELLGDLPAGPLLGVFTPGLMPPVLRGDGATSGTADPYTCEDNPEFEGLPSLPEMVATAISRLERNGSFILVVEDEAIDEHTHHRRPCGHIGGVAQIDEALRLVQEYAQSHPELLVIVTADHGHAAQIISTSVASGRGWTSSPGYTAQLITVDGSVMGVNYGTTKWPSSEVHSGVQVPLLASGPGVSEWPIFMRQTEVFQLMRKHLGLEDSISAAEGAR